MCNRGICAALYWHWLPWSQVQANVGWFSPASRAQRMFIGVFLTLIPAALMALTLMRSGISRHDLYLTKGDLAAPATLPIVRGARWNVIAPWLLILISGGLITQLWIISNASRHLRPSVLLVGLPAAVVFAAVNASCEEFRFRCVLLARGTRCIGAAHAVAATSLLFGLAHFFGHPAGFTGVVMAAFFAWVLARSMLDTRGWRWAWLLHFMQDVIIFLMVLMTGV
jgi:membrane protease YdiL (CAAX protease family)